MYNIMRILLSLVILAAAVPAQTSSPAMTAEAVLQKVKANFDAVKDYTALISGTVNMERLKVPPMKVKIYFKQPNKFKTESKGTTFLPRNILDINPADLLERFDAMLMGTESNDGKNFYKVRLITKAQKGKPVRESYIWVDALRWTIERLEAFPSEGRKIEVQIENTLVNGKYYLPAKISASFDFEQNADSLAEKIYSPQRVPRKGSAQLIYSEYQVNTGLSDELFEQKKDQ